MELKRGYEESEIGPMAVDWAVRPLGDLVRSVEYGSSARSKGNGAVPVLRMGNIQDGKVNWDDLVFTDDEAEVRKYQLRPGDVLFNRTNTVDLVGKAALYDSDRLAIFAGYLIRIEVAPDRLEPRFLNYILNAEFARRYSRTVLSLAVGQANINGEKLKTYPIPTPPTLEEQRAIATALSDVDGLLEGLDRLIAKKRDLKQAAMQQLLTGDTRLKGFDGEWTLTRLGDHVTFLSHGTNSRAELRSDGPVKYLHYGDIHACTLAMLEPAVLPSLPEEKAKGLDRLRDGDLVFADASEDLAGVSKSVELHGVGDTELVAGLHTIAARFDKGVLADGFKAYLQFCPAFSGQLRRLAAGTKVYATNRSHIACIEMRLPNADEQIAIAAVFRDMDAEIEALEQRRAKTADLKQAMMQELLTGKTRLVTPEASYA